jgi:hypothetical protein
MFKWKVSRWAKRGYWLECHDFLRFFNSVLMEICLKILHILLFEKGGAAHPSFLHLFFFWFFEKGGAAAPPGYASVLTTALGKDEIVAGDRLFSGYTQTKQFAQEILIKINRFLTSTSCVVLKLNRQVSYQHKLRCLWRRNSAASNQRDYSASNVIIVRSTGL